MKIFNRKLAARLHFNEGTLRALKARLGDNTANLEQVKDGIRQVQALVDADLITLQTNGFDREGNRQ